MKKHWKLTYQRIFNNPRIWLGIGLISLLCLVIFSPMNIIFDRNFLIQYFNSKPCCVVGLFITIYTVLTVIGVPGTILTFVGGIIFGLSWGTFWSVFGATLGALGAFWLARYLLHDPIELYFGKHKALASFKQAVVSNPFSFVLAVRFAPISPFNVVNFLFGLTPIHWLPYTIATFVGIIPGTLAYTWLGVSGIDAIQGGNKLSVFLAMGLLGILSLIPLVMKKRRSSKQ
jgi:uncharacterized membrane protein YdjX (TVP38/TMEM64 family)